MVSRNAALLCMLLIPLTCAAQPKAKPRLDAHGFPLPDGAVARLGNLRFTLPRGTPGTTNTVAITADGKRIACGTTNITIWNADTAQVVGAIPERIFPKTLAWSNDGKRLLSMTRHAESRLWDAETGRPVWGDEVRKPTAGTYVLRLSFIAKDELLAIVTADRCSRTNWRVELWNADTGKLSSLWTIDENKQAKLKALGNGYQIRDVALSPSGERMAWLAASPGGNSAVFLRETVSDKLLSTVKDLPPMSRVALPDEGETLVLLPDRPAKVEQTVTLKSVVVDVARGKERFSLEHRFLPPPYVNKVGLGYVGGRGRVFPETNAVRFGDSLLTRDDAGLVRWNWKSGQKQDACNQYFGGLAVSANGKRLVAGNGKRLYVSDDKLATLESSPDFSYAPSIRFLPDGRLLGVGGAELRSEGPRVRMWNPSKGKVLESLRIYPWPADVEATSTEGPCVDTWNKLLVYFNKTEGFAVHDLQANKRLCLLEGLDRSLWNKRCQAAMSRDGKRVLAYYHEEDRLVALWFDSHSGKELGRYEIPYRKIHGESKTYVQKVQWLADDGSTFGYVTPHHRLTLVNCSTRKVVLTLGIPRRGVSTYPLWNYRSIGNDRFFLASPGVAATKSEFALWDRKGRLLRHFSLPLTTKDLNSGWCFSPDGKVMALVRAQKEVVFYDTATGRRTGGIPLPQDRVYQVLSLGISPEGKYLATASLDTTILLWDLRCALRSGEH